VRNDAGDMPNPRYTVCIANHRRSEGTEQNGLCTTVCTTERAIVTKHALAGFSDKGKAR
jgi:hypothetical protein